MGMFDSIRKRLYCPYCGHLIENDFQTKDFECMLWDLKLKYPIRKSLGYEDTVRIYTSCDKCSSWVELILRKSNVVLPKESDRKMRAKRAEKKWKEYEKGKIISKSKHQFLKELKKW